MLRGFSRGNDPDDATAITLAVADQEKVGTTAHAKHEEAILIYRVRIVVKLHGKLVIEDRLGLLEGDAMLPEVRGGLGWIPVKLDHLYIVWMIQAFARPNT